MPEYANFRTVRQIASLNHAFSVASLRWLIFTANQNGLETVGAIIRIGRKVLIHEDKFDQWVRSHGPDGKFKTNGKTANCSTELSG